MRAPAAAALLLLPLLGGCAEAMQPSGARPLLEAAQSDANAWRPDAVLTRAHAGEMANGTQFVAERGNETSELSAAALGHDDPSLGDGMALAWGFAFHSPAANRSYEVVVSAAGEVLAHAERDPQHPDLDKPIPMAEWKLDADEAWRLAKAGNESVRAILAGGEAVLTGQMLSMWGDLEHPIWLIYASTDLGNDAGVLLAVDAGNGTLYDIQGLVNEIVRGLIPVFRETGSANGFVTPNQPTATHGFDINGENHRVMAVSLVLSDETLPGQRVSMVVAGPDGGAALYINHTRATAVHDETAFALLEEPQPGGYTATVTLDPPGASGIAASYAVAWCTDGHDLGLGAAFSNETCDALPS